tara:strand:- start:5353 stop:6366 length:1014 start_codon:yes stop_codon:yes gene_type:complete
MNRKDFLKGMGLAGVGLSLPTSKLWSKPLSGGDTTSDSCVLIPSETEGPFPLDLTENSAFFRQDVREDRDGVQFNLKLKIIGQSNCEPMQNVRVNIWHCDKDGLYSGYDNNMNPGQAGLTYLRGYQMTDANGEVEFTTIFPGWYDGRITHIHFQVYVSSSYSVVSQLSFDPDTKNSIYTDNSSIYTNGVDPMTFAQDNIFSDGYDYQIATLTENSSTGGWESYLEVTVQGEGTVGVGHIEKQNAKQFSLGQNYPNPFVGETTIPVSLNQASDVSVDLYDMMGRKVASVAPQSFSSGEQSITLNMEKLGLPTANYLYQIKVENSNGSYVDSKMMTASR